MASYWKSQPRKMCDICKCWISDNKASIDFHERGKSHQEKKKKYLNDVRKRSHQQHKEEQNLDSYLRNMEKAAKKQYEKDQAQQALDATNRFVEVETKTDNQTSPTSKTIGPKSPPELKAAKTEYNNLCSKPKKPKFSKKSFKIKNNLGQSGEKDLKIEPAPVVHASPAAYGKWVTVKTEETSIKALSFQEAEPKEKEEKFEFVERTHYVKKELDSAHPVAFKKRKVTNRSVRQRSDV